MFLINLLLCLVAAKQCLFYLQIIQRKEYRMDKMLDFMPSNEFRQLMRKPWKLLRPSFTTKAKLLATISVVLSSFLILIAGSVWESALFALFPIIPVLLSILLTYPLDRYLKSKKVKAASVKRAQLKNLKVIGISGSFGKTTVKYYLTQLLNSRFKVEATDKFENTLLGNAEKLNSLDSNTEILIAEIGAYDHREGQKICELIQPDIGIVTGLNNQHIALFKTSENIITGESHVLNYAAKNYVNMTTKLSQELANKHKNIEKYNDKTAKKIKLSLTGSSFELNGEEYKTNLFTKGNIENLTVAIMVAEELGVSKAKIKKIVKDLQTPPGTLEVSMSNGVTTIDDSHNANYDGVLNALSIAKLHEGYKVLVMDEIAELGTESKRVHTELSEVINDSGFDKVLVCGKNFSTELLSSIDESKIINSKEELENIVKNKENVLLLLEGYRARNYKIT